MEAPAGRGTSEGRCKDREDRLCGGSRAEGFWIAVLPFMYSGSSADIVALGEGLSGGDRHRAFAIFLPEGRGESFDHASTGATTRTLAAPEQNSERNTSSKEASGRRSRDCGLQYIWWRPAPVPLVVGNLRSRISGGRSFRFAGRTGAADRLDSRGHYGVLPHAMSERLRGRDPEELTPYETVLRSFAHFPRLSGEEHAAARAALERATRQSPGYADAWAMLSMLVREEYMHGFNVKADPLGRALAAGLRSVEIAPSNHLAYHALAARNFFVREIQAFRNSTERAISLNRMDGFTSAYLGSLVAYAGEWARGSALIERHEVESASSGMVLVSRRVSTRTTKRISAARWILR